MKKLLTLALAVLGISAAQALTVEWTTDQSKIDTAGTFTVALKVNLAASDINTNRQYLIVSGPDDNDTIWAAVGTSNSKSEGRVWVNDTAKFWSRGTVHEGENIFAMIFERDVTSNNANRSLAVSYYINGTFVASSGTGTYWTTDHATTNLNDIVASSGGTLYFANGAAIADDFAAVPEPTVLALLALGVAGVALRRKKVVA